MNEMPHDDLVPINDPESAIGAGWLVERDERVLAELTEPMYVSGSQFWYSYQIIPITNDPAEIEELTTSKFWRSDKIIFRSRKFGVIAPTALTSQDSPCSESHRVKLRGMHIKVDMGETLVEKLMAFLKKRFK